MIEKKEVNIFDLDTEAIVNAVNCQGVMGAGIALQFKRLYPENYKKYRKACMADTVKIGTMFIVRENDKTIINFPTKNNWEEASDISYITSGLKDLKNTILNMSISSIAIPKLGCGLGGLNEDEVVFLIEEELKDIENVNIIICI